VRERGGSVSLHELGGLYAAAPLLSVCMFLLLLAIGGLPPGSGLWPKIVVVKAALDHGAGWLAFAVLLSGFLTMVALARVFLLVFWRPAAIVEAGGGSERTIAMPGVAGLLPLLALCLAILWLGLLPETAASVARTAADGLVDPSAYVRSVFPGGTVP